LVFKVLHVSDGSLPDWRIEKAAISSKNKGYEVYFAGILPSLNYKRLIFAKLFELKWSPRARYHMPLEWYGLKKQMKKIIDEVRPDIIHAHNVFSAKMAKEIDTYPVVYDNHEYWSKYLVYQYKNNGEKYYDKDIMENLKRSVETFGNQIKKTTRKMWIGWDLEATLDFPSLVPSFPIKAELAGISKKVFVLPNFPLKNEIESIDPPTNHASFSSVYAGTMPYKGYQTPIKNIDGFLEMFETGQIGRLNVIGWKFQDSDFIKYHGFMDRTDMIKEMSNNSIGFIPWKKHPFHPYCSPNKAYEYAHAGLIVFSTTSLQPIFDALQNHVIGFDDYSEMVEKLLNLLSNQEEVFSKRVKIYEFARSNLLWENYENNIFEAYKEA